MEIENLSNENIKENIVEELNANGFAVRWIEYKSEEDKSSYGMSFDAVTQRDFKLVKVNKVECKAKRIIEEYGKIVLVHNYNQVSIALQDISSWEVL